MPPRSAPLPGPAPVTKNVILGACGNCGGAAGGCCALTPDVTPSASAAIINAFDLLISVASLGMIDTVAEFPTSCSSRHKNKCCIRLIPLTWKGHSKVSGGQLTDVRFGSTGR